MNAEIDNPFRRINQNGFTNYQMYPMETKTQLQKNLLKIAELYESGLLDEEMLTDLIKKAVSKK